MRSRHISALASAVLFTVAAGSSGGAIAADLPAQAPPTQYLPAWSWAGFYGGVHAAATRGQTTFSNPYGASIFGGRAPTPGYGYGVELGYNWQSGNWVYGLEADATLLNSSGSTTCAAASGMFTSSNCGASPKAVGTVTGRLGLALGPSGHTLLYAKGGFAWQHGELSASRNNNPFFLTSRPAVTNSTSRTEPGWTVGAGVEQSLTPAWSVVLEYDFLDFGRQGSVFIPASVFGPFSGNRFEAIPGANSHVSSNVHMFKLGLNYRFGQDPWAPGWGTAVPAIDKAPPMAFAPGWEFEGGGRYWYSWGRFQRDVGRGPGNSHSLLSRLTYDNMTANTGEFFGRIDTPVNVFLKGFVGGGSISGGHLNDEDWDPRNDNVLYSNTSSGRVTGPLSYGTIDIGYDLFRGANYKAGPLVGYNRYDDTMNAGGCLQIANPSGSCGGDSVPTSQTVITEKDTWDSLRVGAAAEMMLADRWTLSGDLAYVPYTKFTGVDHHLLFSPVEIFNERGHGQGVQAEAFLSYLVTNQFSVGVGARYWAMWTTSAAETVAGSASNDDTLRTERFGVTFQASYKFDVPH